MMQTPKAMLAGVLLAGTALAFPPQSQEWREALEKLVEQTIAHPPSWRDPVRDPRVLEAMRQVPRHLFLPAGMARYAYLDRPLPIGEDQTISQPYMVAKMTELLRPKANHRVLEIGTGSGYQAAVLSGLVQEVYTIEIVPALAREASERLKQMGYKNVHVREGDGYLGWPEKAPFDSIIVTAGATHLPQPLLEQLKPGGIMVIPVGEPPRNLVLQVVHRGKTPGDVRIEEVMPVAFVPLTGERARPPN